MANTVVRKLVCALVRFMVVTAPYVEAQMTCNLVMGDLSSCVSYLQSGGAVPKPCCKGINSLMAAAKDTPARQTACRCLKQLASSIPGIRQDTASSLPAACGVSVGYPISASVDCSTALLWIVLQCSEIARLCARVLSIYRDTDYYVK